MAILVTAYKVWNLSKMFYLVNINLESTSKISLERNLKCHEKENPTVKRFRKFSHISVGMGKITPLPPKIGLTNKE